ncbi:hypothetical protein BHQ15_12270 [Mycolicibacillus koreensis]|nr:hypothetical protein BHQ15_12270 [Mycolicibacillus koreensis]
MTREVGRLDPEMLRSAIQLMRSLATDRLSTVDVAEHAGYSPWHFIRMFSASTGISPGLYLAALRVDAAKRLLLADSAPVIDVAASVGYDSLSSFTRRFRTMVGTSPGMFRELADTVAAGSVTPFTLGDARQSVVWVRPHISVSLRPGHNVALWIGWFPKPAPIGLPTSGVLTTSHADVAVPLSPGNPWLLSFAVSAHAGAEDQLVPTRPLVARFPAPLVVPTTVDLHYRQATDVDLPLLSALPALKRAP